MYRQESPLSSGISGILGANRKILLMENSPPRSPSLSQREGVGGEFFPLVLLVIALDRHPLAARLRPVRSPNFPAAPGAENC